MTDDDSLSRSTVETPATACHRCGTATVHSYHAQTSCSGPIVRVGSEWKCTDCGVEIDVSTDCADCDAVDVGAVATGQVAVRPNVPVSTVETALEGLVDEWFETTISSESTLSAIARTHSHNGIEHDQFGDGDESTLDDQLQKTESQYSSYQFQECHVYPVERTPSAIVTEVRATVERFSTDTRWTDFGVGVAFDSNGGVRVTIIAVQRVATGYEPDTLERAIHRATNAQRQQHGFESLSFSHHLSGIARHHSRQMATDDFFSHDTPDGLTVSDRYRRGGHDPRPAGENISKQYPHAGTGPDEIAANVVNGWMNSSGHRENLLSRSWEREGIGVYHAHASDGALLVTQNFG